MKKFMEKERRQKVKDATAERKDVTSVCVKMYGYEITFPVIMDDYPVLFGTLCMIAQSKNGEDLKILLDSMEKVLTLYTNAR